MKKDRAIKTQKKMADDLLIRSPEEEYEGYVQRQIDQFIQCGETEKANLYKEALEKGIKVLITMKNKIPKTVTKS